MLAIGPAKFAPISMTPLEKTFLVFLVLSCTAFSTGCSASRGPEVRSKLDYLHGRNWEKSQFKVGGSQVPIGMKKIDSKLYQWEKEINVDKYEMNDLEFIIE